MTRLVFWFFRQPTAKTPVPIFTINTSNDVVLCKDVPFGDSETKFYILTQFAHKKKQIMDQVLTGLRKFRLKKGLNNGDDHK